jgi:hypothetical protein
MPYIKKELRDKLEPELTNLCNRVYNVSDDMNIAGTLNYVISTLLCKTILYKTIRYASINTICGILECVKLEFYRRLGGKYEDQCIKNNGDVEVYESQK